VNVIVIAVKLFYIIIFNEIITYVFVSWGVFKNRDIFVTILLIYLILKTTQLTKTYVIISLKIIKILSYY